MEKYDMKVYIIGERVPIVACGVEDNIVDTFIHALNNQHKRMYHLTDDIWINTQYVTAVVCKEREEEQKK